MHPSPDEANYTSMVKYGTDKPLTVNTQKWNKKLPNLQSEKRQRFKPTASSLHGRLRYVLFISILKAVFPEIFQLMVVSLTTAWIQRSYVVLNGFSPQYRTPPCLSPPPKKKSSMHKKAAKTAPLSCLVTLSCFKQFSLCLTHFQYWRQPEETSKKQKFTARRGFTLISGSPLMVWKTDVAL